MKEARNHNANANKLQAHCRKMCKRAIQAYVNHDWEAFDLYHDEYFKAETQLSRINAEKANGD